MTWSSFLLRVIQVRSKYKQKGHFLESFRKESGLKLILQLLIHQPEFIECCYIQDPVNIKKKYVTLIHKEPKLTLEGLHENAPLELKTS